MGRKKTADMSAQAVEDDKAKTTKKPADKAVKKATKTKETAVSIVEMSPASIADTSEKDSESTETMKETKKVSAKKKSAPKKKETTTSDMAESLPDESPAEKPVKKGPARSRRYTAARAFVDKTSTYPIPEAIALVRKTHYARFPGTVEAHLVLRDEATNVEVTFPYTTGQNVTVAVATDAILAEVEKGVINFNILVAHPSMMPKLAKLARVLGPKGLMPNPKNGTVTPDPEKRKKELEGGATMVRGEKKAPLAHVVIGKLSQPDEELVANLSELFKAYPAGKLLKCTVSATMGPGIKVAVG